MPTYEISAWVHVTAESPEKAKEDAEEIAHRLSKSGDFSLGIDDGEPIDIDDELDEEDDQ